MKRTTTATLIGAATLIALAGCGSSGAAVSEGDSVELDALSTDVDAAMRDAGTGSMKAESDGVELEGDFQLGKTEAASVTGTTGGQPVDLRVVDGVHYLKAPSPEVTQKGKTWIKADPESKKPQDQQLASSMTAMTDLRNPLAAIDGAEDAKAEVTKVEDDRVTYEIALSKKQMGAVLEQQAKDAGDEQGAAMAAQQARKTTTTLVVDKGDLPVEATTKAGQATLDVAYSSWGEDVSVEAPPKGTVGTLEVPTRDGPPGSGSSSSQ
ncbi:hypothetical protein [Janibacter alittae]|uniref:LppX_LprAFG lipoprotein n=1 Tax=Janibacter alittae TaxID=3115209 RepID=A0ABZ2MIW6_9MICO